MGVKPVAIVTGGQGGIGRAIVARLAAAGFTVVSGDLTVAPAESDRPDPARDGVFLHHLDVTSSASVTTAVAAAARLGPVTALVNCAGILRVFAPDGFDDDTARHMFEVNLLGAARVVSVTLGVMADGGAIVNISSVAPRLHDQPQTALYAASKAGLETYTGHLAHGLASRRIRVNAVAPGIVDVAMTDAMRQVALAPGSPLSRCPAGRMATAEEIAEGVAFLLSDQASYVNGTTLVIDGGIGG